MNSHEILPRSILPLPRRPKEFGEVTFVYDPTTNSKLYRFVYKHIEYISEHMADGTIKNYELASIHNK